MKDSTKGIITILLSNLLMTAGALLIKAVPESVSGFYRILFTCAFSLVIGVPILFVLRDKTRPRNIKFLLLRGFFGAIPMTLFFLAVSYSGVGRATLLSTTYPVFSAVYGYFFFKERAGASVWIGAILCIAGSVVVFRDGGSANLIGDITALSAGVVGGLATQYIKIARRDNDSLTVYLAVGIFGVAINLFSIPETSHIDVNTLLILTGIGASFFVGNVIMNYGFRYVGATRAAVLTLLKIPLGILFGAVVFSEPMNIWFGVGSVMIIAGIAVAAMKREVTE
jgi:drug/metabolite transporter (DMT)-like permease